MSFLSCADKNCRYCSSFSRSVKAEIGPYSTQYSCKQIGTQRSSSGVPHHFFIARGPAPDAARGEAREVDAFFDAPVLLLFAPLFLKNKVIFTTVVRWSLHYNLQISTLGQDTVRANQETRTKNEQVGKVKDGRLRKPNNVFIDIPLLLRHRNAQGSEAHDRYIQWGTCPRYMYMCMYTCACTLPLSCPIAEAPTLNYSTI